MLSRLIQAKCVTRHRTSVEKDFLDFLEKNPISETNEIVERLKHFNCTKHLPSRVLIAYYEESLENCPESLSHKQRACSILKQICKNGAETISSETLFNNPVTHAKLRK